MRQIVLVPRWPLYCLLQLCVATVQIAHGDRATRALVDQLDSVADPFEVVAAHYVVTPTVEKHALW